MYKKAIDILTMKDVDLKRIAIEVAKSNPSIFISAYQSSIGMSTLEKFFDAKSPIEMCKNLNISDNALARVVEKYGSKKWLPQFIELCLTKDEPCMKINAIKHIREIEKIGLKEAKHICDDIISMAEYY